jgi:retron-type reverse transcriptase
VRVELVEHLKRHGQTIAAKLLAGTYTPSPVKRVIIAKPDGGERLLGIPTVLDQQAISNARLCQYGYLLPSIL